MWLTAILAFLVVLTMIFDYFYGFYSNYFFNKAGFGIYKFIGVTIDFAFWILLYHLFFCSNKKDIFCNKREIIQLIFDISIIAGTFLFFISDSKDPETSSSFSMAFIWIALLAAIPLYSSILWGGLSVITLSLTFVFVLYFGQNQKKFINILLS